MTDQFAISPTVKRAVRSAGVTVDDLLRETLGLKDRGFTSNGVYFAEGMIFGGWYKERPVTAIIKNGAIEVDGKTFSSFSGAAAHVTGRPTTNGWAFWFVKHRGQFVPIIQKRNAA